LKNFFICFYLFLSDFFCFGLVAGVVEETLNLAGHGGHDGAVEERVETGEQERTNNDGNEDLHAGIDVAFSLLGGDGCFRSDDGVVRLVLDGVKKLFHDFYLFLSDFFVLG